MPPSGRRRARNKEPDHEQETSEITTPSRKRRRINGTDSKPAPAATSRAMRRASAESDETIENQFADDTEAESLHLYDVAEEIIRHLRVAHYEVGVSIDHNNQVVEQSAQAFAKIAGRTWTYYVSNLNVIIGRPNVKTKSPGNVVGGETPHMDMQVDIDLGPDQQVSRLHAEISYDQDREQWFVIVNGRNGLTVDEQRLEKGQKLYLHSGNVIGVLGTQMMFMLPNEPPVVHPVIRKALLPEEDDDEADLAGDKALPYSGSFKPRGRPAAVQQNQPQSARPPPQQNSTRAAQTLAALSSSQPMPGTPLQRNREQPQPKSKPSPAYARGLLLETTEEIDYSADSARDIKPPHSYAQMIGQAILSTPDANATLARIYEFIKEKYAFFRFGGGGWQNSIRHNLSLSKHFEKIPRRTDEPGKGMKWQIVPDHRTEYMKKNFHDNRRAVRRVGSSSPNSPAGNLGPSTQTERLLGAIKTGESVIAERPSPRSTTPPLTGFARQAFPAPTESFTPDRGPRPGNLQTMNLSNGNGIGPGSAQSESFTPTFDRGLEPPHSALAHRGPTSGGLDGTNETAVDSPTTFRNGTGAYDLNAGSNLFTPLPPRAAPKQNIFSTVKPPSFYARELFSSPAPFWKYVDMGSTPPRPQPNFGESPEKRASAEGEDEEDDDEDEDSAQATTVLKKDAEDEDTTEPVVVQPSSPPPAHLGSEGPDESPSRTISRPVSRREGPPIRGLEPVPKFAPPAQPKFGLNPSINGPAFSLYSADMNGDDDDEEKGIDLAKGFQKIGSFHRSLNGSMQAASSVGH